MSNFSNHGPLAPGIACARFRQTRAADIKRWLCSSVAPLGLLAFFAAGAVSPALAQGTAQAAQKPENLGPVVVSPPQPKPVRRTESVAQRSRTAVRAAGRPRAPSAAVPAPVPGSQGGQVVNTPLNGNVVAEIASRLNLPVREIPASIDVIDKQTIQDQGLRTTTDVAQAAVGVTAGDSPGAPASFSMRGFTGTQINTLYNGIKIGPAEMTNRIMDTANLDRVEIVKEPASLLSGEGATGGSINYVNKVPHTGPITNDAFVGFDSFRGYRAGYGSGGSTLIDGLDYRFDVSHSNNRSFIDDTYARLSNVSGQLNYKVTDSFKIWGAVVRHVGDRFNFQDNFVTMDAYTLYDAYAFVDIPKSVFNGVSQTRVSFRVKNLTNKRYAQWGDPGYTDQIILGAPRSYEVASSFKW